MRLKDKRVIITGAAAGIGEASCRRFAAEGARIVAADSESKTLQEVVHSLCRQGFECHPLATDVADESACQKLVDWTAKSLGGIDVLFNNAGVVHQGTLLESPKEDWDDAMNINAKSMFWMSRFSIPFMQQQRSGSIINMSSVSAIAGVANRGVYSVSKAAVVGLTLSLAKDFITYGIRVNCICPATVDTPSLRQRIASAPDPQKAQAEFLARQPMGRIATADEVASLALYLASDESTYMTGQSLIIDGGMTL